MAKTILYYRVKKPSDMLICGMLVNNGNLFSAGELYTPTEIRKALHKKYITEKDIHRYFERVELRPSQVNISNGGRFISVVSVNNSNH